MEWSLAQLAEATSGTLGGAVEPAGKVGSVAIDSRDIRTGAVFVPLVAARDGHEFINDAVAAGATAVFAAADHLPLDPSPPVPVIGVADTAAALSDLGRAARRRLGGPVVGITGSVGKTSTKDLAAAALATGRRVTASEKSFNNELGVPLTLANAAVDTDVTVIEMGARGAGHIARLCEVARPTIGVVTVIAAVHTELFGTVDDVAAAKGELIEALPASGTAVLNADDPRVAALAGRSAASVLRHSAAGRPADVTASGIEVDDEVRARFQLSSPWGSAAVHLGARGAHQVGNALAAASVALLCGIEVGAVAAALGQATLSPWRMQLERTAAGGAVLNDAYNANPTSMAASLRALAALPATRRVAVLGVMAELGPSAAADHAEMARLAEALGVAVVAVGTPWYGVDPVDGIDEAVDAVYQRLGGRPIRAGDAVLVKASRVAALERVAARLLADAAAT